MRKIFPILALLVAALTSCTNYSGLRINSVELGKVNIRAMSDIDAGIKLGIENPLSAGLFIKGGEGYIKNNGSKFAKVIINGSDTAKAKSSSVCLVNLNISLEDPMAALTLGLSPEAFTRGDLRLDGFITIGKTNGGSRKLRVRDYPLKNLSSLMNKSK